MNSIFDISDKPLDDKLRLSLRSLAVMAGTTAIVMLINATLSIIGGFMALGSQAQSRSSREGFGSNMPVAPETSTVAFAVQTIITLVIWGVLFYFLFGFSRKTIAGLDANNQDQVTTGLGNLASYFKVVGILLCFITGLLVLAVLAAL